MTPALTETTGRLAADLPQQAARNLLTERFSVTPSVDAYRRVITDLTTQVRCVRDEEAVKQLLQWIGETRQSEGETRHFATSRPRWRLCTNASVLGESVLRNDCCL